MLEIYKRREYLVTLLKTTRDNIKRLDRDIDYLKEQYEENKRREREDESDRCKANNFCKQFDAMFEKHECIATWERLPTTSPQYGLTVSGNGMTKFYGDFETIGGHYRNKKAIIDQVINDPGSPLKISEYSKKIKNELGDDFEYVEGTYFIYKKLVMTGPNTAVHYVSGGTDEYNVKRGLVDMAKLRRQ